MYKEKHCTGDAPNLCSDFLIMKYCSEKGDKKGQGAYRTFWTFASQSISLEKNHINNMLTNMLYKKSPYYNQSINQQDLQITLRMVCTTRLLLAVRNVEFSVLN